mmetsp:Transcript_55684/g.166835  ORF Transcript_55684/g.166835 Transcript_55684/m.166835 type:complete len:200 (-) Transcript_55684:1919-2518(-)
MQREVWKGPESTHCDLILIFITLFAIIIGASTMGEDYFVVAFGSKSTRFQQRLAIEETAPVSVLSGLDVVKGIPTNIKAFPEFVGEKVFTIRSYALLQRNNIHPRVPFLYNTRTTDALGCPNIFVTEKELTGEVGYLDSVHICDSNVPALPSSNAHERQTLQILAPQCTTTNEENACFSCLRLKVFAHYCNLVIIAASK